ncbi:hypothetical protein G3I77_23590 [Streptomyces sp. D2-8]|uniref:hypothetical protein n=1 Tax=Streptomyces sp. D2-8 TaxID=2707767 RepID=UPI0020BDC69A|nr:hypothetical protein [Streptomyces sp. D2-8]MCK8435886.1 hypothetical protein [Streptomyces sp. D2-8]
MSRVWDWESGEGLLRLDDPGEWDSAFERGEAHLGTAVIGLANHCSPAEASPRIARAMRLPDAAQWGFAFTAAGHVARLNGELTPELYAALRAEGHGGAAEHAIRDTLTFVPFRKLPPWFKRRWVYVAARDRLEAWWLRCVYAAEDAWRAARGRRS